MSFLPQTVTHILYEICIELILRALFLGQMRNVSREMNSCMPSKDKLGFAIKNFASPVKSVVLTVKAKKVAKFNSITPYFARRLSPSWNQAFSVASEIPGLVSSGIPSSAKTNPSTVTAP